MGERFDRHRARLGGAPVAVEARGFWTPFPEVPGGKFHRGTARDDRPAADEERLGRPFTLAGRPESHWVGAEISSWGPAPGVAYPATNADTPVAASEAEARVGVWLEALVGCNVMSFAMGNAGMHVTGQAGNADLIDAAFVAGSVEHAMCRRPQAAWI